MVAPVHVGKPSEVTSAPKTPPTTPAPQGNEAPKATRAGVYQVHNIVRTISKTGGAVNDAWPLDAIESYLADYFKVGWRLFAVLHLAEAPEGHTCMWTLVREI